MPRKLSSLTDLGGPKMDDLTYANSLSGLGDDPEKADDQIEIDEEPVDIEAASKDTEDKKDADSVVEDYVLTTQQEWINDLKEIELPREEAERILDMVMSTGKYEESYRMGKTQFKLRTRTTVDADRTIEILQQSRPDSTGVYAHLISRINLASSIVAYGSEKFPHTSPASDNREQQDNEWRARYRFCASLPSPVFYALTQVLQRFDIKVNLSCDARGLENF